LEGDGLNRTGVPSGSVHDGGATDCENDEEDPHDLEDWRPDVLGQMLRRSLLRWGWDGGRLNGDEDGDSSKSLWNGRRT